MGQSRGMRVVVLFGIGLASAAIYCPALDFLNLTHCAELRNLTLVCPKITTLLCAGCKHLPDAQMRQAMQSCRSLQMCDVKGCILLTPETVAELEQLCRGQGVTPAPVSGGGSSGSQGGGTSTG